MSSLDNVVQIKKLDKSGMADFIADLPDQMLKAYKQSKKIKLPDAFIIEESEKSLKSSISRFSQDSEISSVPKAQVQNISNIVSCGMGGSAIGGDIVKTLTHDQLQIPFIVNRSYQLPSMVDKNSLVFLVSFSGNTQETLSCAKQAIKKKARVFVITSGGKLKKLAQEKNLPIFTFDYKGQPRAALGYLFMPMLITLEKLDLINLDSLNIPKSIEKLKNFNQLFYPETTSEKNIAKYLAYLVFDHLPIIIAPQNLGGIARRFKTQMAENAKTFSFFETAPEIFHNSIESRLPWRLKDEFVFLILESTENKTKLKKSLTAYKQLLDKENMRWEAIPAFGDNIFLNILSFILSGDWISFYLSILNEVDPTPVKRITWLKHQLNK